jgi:hypothetical protein
VARHHRQIELAIPPGGRRVGQHPLDVRAEARLVEHGGIRVKPAQAAGVAQVACAVQQSAGAAANVEHAIG